MEINIGKGRFLIFARSKIRLCMTLLIKYGILSISFISKDVIKYEIAREE